MIYELKLYQEITIIHENTCKIKQMNENAH